MHSRCDVRAAQFFSASFRLFTTHTRNALKAFVEPFIIHGLYHNFVYSFSRRRRRRSTSHYTRIIPSELFIYASVDCRDHDYARYYYVFEVAASAPASATRRSNSSSCVCAQMHGNNNRFSVQMCSGRVDRFTNSLDVFLCTQPMMMIIVIIVVLHLCEESLYRIQGRKFMRKHKSK